MPQGGDKGQNLVLYENSNSIGRDRRRRVSQGTTCSLLSQISFIIINIFTFFYTKITIVPTNFVPFYVEPCSIPVFCIVFFTCNA